MLLVFHGGNSHPLSFLLKKNFKHVFACVDDGTYWIRIDRTVRGTEIEVVAGSDYDMTGFYENEGFTVVEVESKAGSLLPLEFNNCVGTSKTIAGIRSFCLTPWQLYTRIT